MPAPKTVLLLAPESDLRRSLTFMLSAEGFSVEAGVAWPHDGKASMQAVILDDSLLGKDFNGDDALRAMGRKVLVLSARSKAYSGLPAATVIYTPLLDHVVVNTINGLNT